VPFPTIINMSPSPQVLPAASAAALPSIQHLTRVYSAMLYQIRIRTRVTNTSTSLSAASSVTLEDAGPATDRPSLGKRSEVGKPKRGFGVLPDEIARKFHMPRIGDTELIGA
jgi:hypothetical protein